MIAFFTSKEIFKWLIKNEFKLTTRIKKNKTVYINGVKYILEDLKLNENESIVCTIKGIDAQFKILMFYHKNEKVYACTNDISLSNEELKAHYKSDGR